MHSVHALRLACAVLACRVARVLVLLSLRGSLHTKEQNLHVEYDHACQPPLHNLTVRVLNRCLQVVQGKMAFASALAGMHPLGKAVTDPEAALAGLMGKMGQFKQMLTSAGQGHAKAIMSG